MAQKKADSKAPKASAKTEPKATTKAKSKPTAMAKPKKSEKELVPGARSPAKPAAKPKAPAKQTKLSDFLIGLSKNPKQVNSYQADPEGTMKKAGVGKKDRDVLLTRDGKKIRKHLGDDYPPGCIIDFI